MERFFAIHQWPEGYILAEWGEYTDIEAARAGMRLPDAKPSLTMVLFERDAMRLAQEVWATSRRGVVY